MLPKVPSTLQVTVLSLEPVTCAMNCCCSPRSRVAVAGVIATLVGGGGDPPVDTTVEDRDPQPVMPSVAARIAPNRGALVNRERILAPQVDLILPQVLLHARCPSF